MGASPSHRRASGSARLTIGHNGCVAQWPVLAAHRCGSATVPGLDAERQGLLTAGASAGGGFALACCGCFLRRGGPCRCGPRRGCLASELSALSGRGMVFRLAAAAATLLAAASLLVHGSPCTPLGFALGYAAMLVPLLNMLGLSFLLVRISGLSPRGMLFLLSEILLSRREERGPYRNGSGSLHHC